MTKRAPRRAALQVHSDILTGRRDQDWRPARGEQVDELQSIGSVVIAWRSSLV